MYYDKDSTLYVATRERAHYYQYKMPKTYNIYAEASRFKENNMLTVYKDSRDLLWIGHPHGLSIWNQEETTPSTSLTRKTGLPPISVRSHHGRQQQQQMWIGTGNGISRIKITKRYIHHRELLRKQRTDIRIRLPMSTPSSNCRTAIPDRYSSPLFKLSFKNILTTSYDANIYLTDIEFKMRMPHPDILNGSSLECAQHLSSLKGSSFTIPSSALDLVETDKSKYAYKIHSNWIYAENNKVNLSMLTARMFIR